jgi:proteasome accessory factor A
VAARLFGIETEYALACLPHDGGTETRARVLGRLLDEARRTLPHLRDTSARGLFLQNGSRLYVDCGQHPELATPECTDPADLVRYVVAGERILATLASAVRDGGGARTEAALFRCNVDYSGAGTTWGCHESYLHRADPDLLATQLVPHLVSRVIYTGAGGFSPRSNGLEFTLSPRVDYLERVISSNSTGSRGIFHTKDEPLCGQGYRRLHVLCGDSSCSHLSTWLEVGATALVVALVEAGFGPGEGVRLAAPLEAMRAFVRDPSCQVTARLAGGGRVTAAAIQRAYLAMAESLACRPFMPPWAPAVCRAWRAMLDRIESDVASLATRVDWAIKQALYADRARRAGVAWESLGDWTFVLSEIGVALDRLEQPPERLTVEQVLDSLVRERGLRWEQLRPFVDLRRELFEADMRFGQLGERGVFGALDRAGVIEHHVPGVERFDEAVKTPPAGSRARVRGEFIRKAAGSQRFLCGWEQVSDIAGRRALDLSDPFETRERWRQVDELPWDLAL